MTHPPTFKVGDIVVLSDEDSIKKSMAEGKGVNPKEYTIQKITTIKEQQNLAHWVMLHLNAEEIILARFVDLAMDFYFYTYTGLPMGNRKQQLDAGFQWLFQAPADPNNFNVLDLKYSTDVVETKDDTGETIKYDIKPQGELSGKAFIDPTPSGLGQLVGTIVEYANSDGRQALITEVGSLDNDAGGVITLYTGKQIPTRDIDFLSPLSNQTTNDPHMALSGVAIFQK